MVIVSESSTQNTGIVEDTSFQGGDFVRDAPAMSGEWRPRVALRGARGRSSRGIDRELLRVEWLTIKTG